ncbi:MAG: site-specific integrase [Opitutaceae bacterium]|nr:site-specific integrase [Opitutaceae bacterium]
MQATSKKIQERLEDTKSVQEVSKSLAGNSRGKNHTDYWSKKVFLPTYTFNGDKRAASLFAVKIQFRGRRELFPLNTALRVEAAKKAKLIWASLIAVGWENTLQEFKPQSVYIPPTFTTVGEYLDYLQEQQFYGPKTFYNKVTKFYTALSSMLSVAPTSQRHMARNGGLKKWRDKLEATRLDQLTPHLVEQWKNRVLARDMNDQQQLVRTKHTLDSYLRTAKAMFGPRILKRLKTFGVTLPEPIPFADAEYVSRGRSAYRYRSRMDPYHLTACAIEELQGERREQLKIFLLALHLGLRRGEIDKLLWRQFDFDQCQLHVEATEFSQLKTEGSECDIGLESELRDFFQAEFQAAQSIFVIDTQIQPRPSQIYAHYRAASEFTALCAWLRAHGVAAQKPIHTLRKEFGRLITEKMGLYAASLALRHTSTAVTSIYYADDTRPKHTGLGRLLAKIEQPEPPRVSPARLKPATTGRVKTSHPEGGSGNEGLRVKDKVKAC